LSVAFAKDGESLLVVDSAEQLTRLDPHGQVEWQVELRAVSHLACRGGRIYAAGWDGRLRCYDEHGAPAWTLDCTPQLVDPDPRGALADSVADSAPVLSAQRAATTSPDVPPGENLLRTGAAKLTVGGTKGWMSEGKLQIQAADLTNGRIDDVETPWLHLDELFWDSQAGRQVWAEIEFPQPTDVGSLTVYENPRHAESWPSEGLVQVWRDDQQRWQTAAFGCFLNGPVNTYALDLRGVKRLRYLPWNSYYRNFYTSEIEVRGRE
jgi:hypothetical protein